MKKLKWRLLSHDHKSYYGLVSTNHSWAHAYRIMYHGSTVITNPKYKVYHDTDILTKYALPLLDAIAAADKHNEYFDRIKSVQRQKKLYANNLVECTLHNQGRR